MEIKVFNATSLVEMTFFLKSEVRDLRQLGLILNADWSIRVQSNGKTDFARGNQPNSG